MLHLLKRTKSPRPSRSEIINFFEFSTTQFIADFKEGDGISNICSIKQTLVNFCLNNTQSTATKR